VGGYLFVKSQPAKEEPFDHFRCPGCKHRLRYQSRQVGHRGKCSHCGHHLTFPPTSQSIS
jgi:transcription initiation factor IIE alpha subunit